MRALLPAVIVLVVVAVLIALTPWLSVVAAVNYSGLCIPRLRYLSDDAKIRSAVGFVLDKGWLSHDGQPNEPRYESVEQYLRLVPDCCAVGGDFGDE